ncbi:MAG: hypothetical protein JSV30_05330 [Candidatus Omnitrophota bacterium]|nr:MAG: hypothetical protein JSV30_05330 [Candidatus Omnitrophota bacterium]
MKTSPLFWPIELKEGKIFCLDETALPDKMVYLKAGNVREAVGFIEDMKTRAFGQVLMAYNIFLMLLEKNKGLKELKDAAFKINESRPTFPFPFFTKMVLGWAKEAQDKNKDISSFTKEKILGFLEYLKDRRIRQAEDLSYLIKNGNRILTHCNVSGSLALAAEFCRAQNKAISFFVTETRPYLQGSRLTAWELTETGFDTTIIPDNCVAFVMSRGLVDTVVVGADQMAQNGDIANKIGTYQIALLARKFDLPFYVFSPPPSNAATGKDIKVEIRPDKELLEFCGKRIAPKGAKGFYPAFDITPNDLITKHIPLKLK